MPEQAQSIRRGSNRLTSRDLGLFQVTNVAFAPATTLPSHYHERTCFAVVLEGTVEKVFTRNRHTSAAGSVVTMPAGEQHADHFAGDGAQLLVVEPQSGHEAQELLHPCASILQSVQHVRDSRIITLAWRVHRELHDPDPVSSLAVSGYVLEMLAQAARAHNGEQRQTRPPAWLREAREYLHDNFNQSFQIADVAEAVGVHPVHLARTFREHCDVSPSRYLRRLRLNWVAARLARSEEPLSVLAGRAGFADQSHLTRLFKRQTGLTPGQYRRAVRPRR